jgi:D-3-phosphoglycerate dehydrogenase
MKIVLVEPLAISEDLLKSIINENIAKEHEVIIYNTRVTDNQTLIKRCKEADIIALGNLPLNKEVLKECHNLKMVAIAFTGVDHVDINYCKEKKIVVSNCAGYSTIAVAELTIGLILNLARNINDCDKATRNNLTKEGLVGFELENKTLGIIGTGTIGCRVAELAKAFGIKVIAYSRTVKDNGLDYKSLDDVLKQSDIVSLHLPLNEKTKDLITIKKLSLMKETAYLINTARGPIVNTNDLAYCLKNGIISKAAVDVFDTEPPIKSSNPLLKLENIIVTPHVAFATKESMIKRANLEFKNIANFINNKEDISK